MRNRYFILLILFLACFYSHSKAQNTTMIIPTPVSVDVGVGQYTFSENTKISINHESLRPAANYLISIFNGSVKFLIEESNDSGDVILNLTEKEEKEGTYHLSIELNKIYIEASSYSGIISGIASLRQLLPPQIETAQSNLNVSLPLLVIDDYPHLSWRGLMLDSSRHFWTVNEIESLLDLMALYKLNKFHWHLTDDQGWRIEIKQYPLLTEKGAWRKLNEQDYACINKANELDKEEYLLPSDRLKIIEGDTIYGGFYTQSDIKHIVSYAKNRGIEVIPEIDMPGHFLAALDQYPNIGCDSLIGWGDFFSSPLCVGKDTAIEFCKNILIEVFELFPTKYIHIGGDEVDKTNWSKCHLCQDRIKKESLSSVDELQSWFLKEIEEFSLDNNKIIIGWDEIIADGLSNEAIIMWWRANNSEAIPTATSLGHKVINTCNKNLYFDYDQTPETFKNLLEYNPIASELSEEQKSLILGVQANIWTEWIASYKHLEYMLIPRIFALSEIAWTEPVNKPSISDLYKKAQSHFDRMDILNINYRVPDIEKFYHINSFVNDTVVQLYNPLKSAEIRYTTDGSIPTQKSKLYSNPISLKESSEFMFKAYTKKGMPSEIYKVQYIKQDYLEPIERPEEINEGLTVKWFDYKGDSCKDIETAPYVKSFEVENIYIPSEAAIPEGKPGNLGLIFTGYIDIPSTGIYTFSLLSDDGSILKVHDEELINNDGSHYPTEITAQIPLMKGLHPIELRYFDVDGGEITLYKLDEEGNRELISNKWFKH